MIFFLFDNSLFELLYKECLNFKIGDVYKKEKEKKDTYFSKKYKIFFMFKLIQTLQVYVCSLGRHLLFLF